MACMCSGNGPRYDGKNRPCNVERGTWALMGYLIVSYARRAWPYCRVAATHINQSPWRHHHRPQPFSPSPLHPVSQILLLLLLLFQAPLSPAFL